MKFVMALTTFPVAPTFCDILQCLTSLCEQLSVVSISASSSALQRAGSRMPSCTPPIVSRVVCAEANIASL